MSHAATSTMTARVASGRRSGSLTRTNVRLGERVAEALLLLAAVSSVAITVGIVGVLVFESVSFFRHVPLLDFLTQREWTPLFADAKFGIAPLVAGTLVTTLVALLLAVPVGTVVSMWLSEYAPRRVREWVKPALELLSAVPTVVYGYFALLLVIPALQWIASKVFSYDLPGSNMLGAGLVMGVMIVPYVASLSEDAMRSVPQNLREGAYAMGATRMQTAWKVVFPASISGVTAAYILAISRALGETMVVAIAAGNRPTLTANPLQPAQTITAFIVQVSLGDQQHGSIGYQSIFAAGLTLMLMTLVFNIAGFYLRRRFREAY